MSCPISEREREELRATMPLLLEKRLGIANLRRSFRCPSPDHEDSTPSARYYSDAHTVHCFGCGKTWDAFSLVGMLYGLTGFVEQAKQLAHIMGYSLNGGNGAVPLSPRPSILDEVKPMFPRPRETDYSIAFDTCLKMYEAMFTPEGNVARDYLHARGIDDDDIVKYGLGFAKHPAELIPEFSVCEPTAKGFVMIPFYDEGCVSASYCIARPVGGGSITNKEWRPKGVAAMLWREWKLRSQAPVLYVVEGVLDAMSLEKQIGKPCVALCSTSNVSRFCGILYHTPPSQRPVKLMIAMDEDKAGRNAAVKLAEALRSIGVPHALMPPYPGGEKDANEWRMAERGTVWEYETECLGENITPLHISRRIDHES